MQRTRRDLARSGGGWTEELEWYARAIRELQALPADARTSWSYLGAIHGFDERQWADLLILRPGEGLPPAQERNQIWEQCQHQGWFFLPWHRGYLWAFEAIVAAKVEELGGPPDWALPYWNYFDGSNPGARRIPDPFTAATMPDGSPNPLSRPPRSTATALGPVAWFPSDIDLEAMDVAFFTSAPRAQGFGGGVTQFNQFGGQTGALESDPHNAVHVILGGADGFMGDPNLAGLDPIFWLHHCNVDRLWAAWLTRAGNAQEARAAWADGPSPRGFAMPDPTGDLVAFTPGETLPDGPLCPKYDDLEIGTGGGAVPAALDEEDRPMASRTTQDPPATTLVGANGEAVSVGATPVATAVEIDAAQATIAGVEGEQRVFLNLEQVRGAAPSGVLSVSIRNAAAGPADAAPPVAVRTVALFGLAKASSPDRGHGGNGISVAVDVTDALKELGQAAGAPLESLEVRLEQPGAAEGAKPITVERVSLYRQPVA